MEDGAPDEDRDLGAESPALLTGGDATLLGRVLLAGLRAELATEAKLDAAGAELAAGAAAPKLARRTAQMTALENLREAIVK